MSVGKVAALILALVRRPGLWPVVARQAHRLAARGWWRRAPFLPLPDAAYMGFRALTQHGDADREPDVADVLVWLVWCREMERGA
ncbi:MAG: hypothetical protein CL406_01290 [Acidimicrobiaceae bacterium]|nr:hypothetical protein [Acidimicrobiaceae bacterium]MDP6481166.1 hypothetical protein [Acidimicrobiales bacterium]MDP6697116.1 hypothetical protein [Acidimicrobiales bacterium]